MKRLVDCLFQFKDYLCKEALVLELWGRQKVNSKQAGAALNTKELMVRERSTARAKTPVVSMRGENMDTDVLRY